MTGEGDLRAESKAEHGPPRRVNPRLGRRGARALGIAMLVASGFVLSGMALLVRLSERFEGLTSSSMAFARFLVGAVIMLSVSRVCRVPLRTGSRRWLALRGVCGAVGVACFFYGITHIGLAKGTLLAFSFPLWAAVLALVLLKERARAGLLVVLVCAFAGLYLVIVPAEGLSGTAARDLVPLVGAVFAGVALVSIRRLRATDSSFVILLSQCVFGMLLMAYPVLTDLPHPSSLGWLLMLAIALTATAGQLMMTFSYRYVSVSEGAAFCLLVPVWNTVLGAAVFGEAFAARGLVGTVLVLGACVYAARPSKRRTTGHPTADER